MTPSEMLLGTMGGVSVLLTLATYGSALRKVHARRLELLPARGAERICVLKPLCGVDDGLLENLRALMDQTDTEFEVVLGSAGPTDPALEVAHQIRREYPERAIEVVSGCAPSGANPKVRLLRHLAQHSSAPWLLISDSNVRPTPSYIAELRRTQQETDADLVHCLLAGTQGIEIGERLEDLQLAGWVAPTVCFTDAWGHPCVIGKSMLLRRTALDAVGGLAAVSDILAEDYVLGHSFWRAGYRVALCPYVLSVINRGRGLKGFVNRHVRWGQMRRRIAPGYFLAELTAQPILFLGPLLLFGGVPARWAALALCLKWLAELTQSAVITGRYRLASAPLLPLKDLLVVGMWFVSFFRRTVTWRGTRMRVLTGSRLVPLAPSQSGEAPQWELVRQAET